MAVRGGIAALALALIVGTNAPAPAADSAPNKCGGTYLSSVTDKRCEFYSKGIPLLIHGDSAASNASVRVWVTVYGRDQVPLLECTDTGSGSASCGTGIPDETTVVNLPHQAATVFFRLVCHVRGSGEGEFGCQAGS